MIGEISKMPMLQNLKILNLESNRIERITNLDSVAKTLEILNLSENKILRLDGL